MSFFDDWEDDFTLAWALWEDDIFHSCFDNDYENDDYYDEEDDWW